MARGQMFVITIIFLAGVISAISFSLYMYSSMDLSETIARNDAFIFKNLKDIVNKTVASSSGCTEAGKNLNELKSFIGRRETQSMEHVIKLDFVMECGKWNNYYPAEPPIRMYLEIVSGTGSSQMITKDYLDAYRSGIAG